MLRPAHHRAYAVLAPAAPAKTSAAPRCLRQSASGLFWSPWGPALQKARLEILSLGLRDPEADIAMVDGAGDVDCSNEMPGAFHFNSALWRDIFYNTNAVIELYITVV